MLSQEISTKFCSWCFEKTEHIIVKDNLITRDIRQCSACKNYTVPCMCKCDHMATDRPEESKAEDFIDKLKESWSSNYCAEHDGTIASFEKLPHRLEDITDFSTIYERDTRNMVKAGKIGVSVAAVALTGGVAAITAAPAVAAAFGGFGALGAAGTGTAISSLSGAALTSASLAAIGPGGVAGGVGIISAGGSALGAKLGGVIGNSYFGEIEDFNVIKIKEGVGSAIICINGFLSQKEQTGDDWLEAISEQYPKNPCYLVTWESSALAKLPTFMTIKGVQEVAKKNIIMQGLRGMKTAASKVAPVAWLLTAADAVANPWHTAMHKASMTGCLLADILARTNHHHGFILMGHSLGARVIYYALCALGTRKNKTPLIHKAYLLGGAVGNTTVDWEPALLAVKEEIINIRSDKDDVLKFAYNIANLKLSTPIGRNLIDHPAVRNYDASHIVNGHTEHKDKFQQVLSDLS